MNIQSELADLIRNKTDEELIALVLGTRDAKPHLVTKPVVSRAQTPRRNTDTNGPSRADLVLKAISSSRGISATEVADKTKLPRAHVTKAIADLKEAGKVFQGGERRFARYATTKKVATDASIASRNGGSKK